MLTPLLFCCSQAAASRSSSVIGIVIVIFGPHPAQAPAQPAQPTATPVPQGQPAHAVGVVVPPGGGVEMQPQGSVARFDVNTGLPLQPQGPVARFDPNTGKPLFPSSSVEA